MRYPFTLIVAIVLYIGNVSAWALTIDQAWDRIRSSNPTISAAQADISAAQGQQTQAGLIPNPTFNTVQGSIPGFGAYSNNPNAQSTYSISQVIELGGKRSGRRNIANAQFEQTQINYQINNAELFSQVVEAFLSVAEAEEKLKLNSIDVILNKKTVSTIKHRIDAGRTSDLDLQAAKISLSNSYLEKATIKSELASAKYSLAKFWNGSDSDIYSIITPSMSVMPLKDLSYYLAKTNKNWQLQASLQAEKISQAEIRLAEAKRYPDITVGVGIDHYFQNSDPKGHNALMGEFSVPIPIFDRNQGNVATAHENYNKSSYESRNKELLLRKAIVNAYQIAVQAKNQINILKNGILPQSRNSLELAKMGYERGKYSYLDLLNAQQKLIDAQMREINAIFMYRRAWFTLQILIGNLPIMDESCREKL